MTNSIAESLLGYINGAGLCVRWVYFSREIKIHLPRLVEEPLKFIAHGRIFEYIIMGYVAFDVMLLLRQM